MDIEQHTTLADRIANLIEPGEQMLVTVPTAAHREWVMDLVKAAAPRTLLGEVGGVLDVICHRSIGVSDYSRVRGETRFVHVATEQDWEESVDYLDEVDENRRAQAWPLLVRPVTITGADLLVGIGGLPDWATAALQN